MKKLFLMGIAIIALTFSSCGNKTNSSAKSDSMTDSTGMSSMNQTGADSLTTALHNQLQQKDSEAVKTTMITVQKKYEELVNSGKLEEAKAYASKVQAFIAQHADNIKEVAAGNVTIATLVEGIKNLPTSAETTAKQAEAAVKSDAKAMTDSVQSKTKQAAVKTVEKAKDNANKAINKTTEQANQKINDASNHLKKSLGI
ncbi:MAG: hypothetical protein WAR39_03435 [Prevotella sp.]